MKNIHIIREDDEDISFDINEETYYLHYIKPEFVKWTGKKFRNIFVGVCSLKIAKEDIIIYSLPKYFPQKKCQIEYLDEIKSTLRKICRVTEKLKNDKMESKIFFDTDYYFEEDNSQDTEKIVNRMELAEYIIEDYLQNGLYVKDVTINNKNSVGRISWAKTVAKVNPIIQGDSIVYTDCINREHVIDENDFMSVIHANVVNQCLNLFGKLLPGEIKYIDDKEMLDDDLSGYASTISIQSSYVFRERDINLFKALEAWCRQTKYYDKHVGVTNFDRVWEWVNDAVWGNVSGVKSNNPIYHFKFDDYGYRGKGNAIPDTVRVEARYDDTTSKKNVYVFDSKYYVLKDLKKNRNNDKDEISGWPANADIVKQIEYLELLKNLINQVDASKIEIEYRNAFLLPECVDNLQEEIEEKFALNDNKWYCKVGYVEQGVFNNLLKEIIGQDYEDNKLKKVEGRKVDIIIVRPEVLYDYYLNNRIVTQEELYKIWSD